MPKILKNTELQQYLNEIKIPNVPMPFPFRLNQKLYNDTVEKNFQLWADRIGLFDMKMECQNLWTFNAGGIPNCDPRVFTDISEMVIMLVVVDDKFDNDDINRLDSKMGFQTFLDAWNGVQPRGSNKLAPAIVDTSRRLQSGMSPFMIHRWRNIIEHFGEAVSIQNSLRKSGIMLPEHEFGLVRRAVFNHCLNFLTTEIGLNLDLTSEDLRDDLFLEIMKVSCDCGALTNDLYSFKKETLHGDTSPQSNMVRLIAKRDNIPIQEAIYKLHELTVANHFKVLELYDRADKKPYRPQMRMFINETKYWVSWLIYLFKYSPRYNLGEYLHFPGWKNGDKWWANEFLDESVEFQETYGDMDWKKVLLGTSYDVNIKFDYHKYTDCLALIGEYEPGTLKRIVKHALKLTPEVKAASPI